MNAAIQGFHGRNSICSVRDPRDLSPINLRSFARGNALGGNNTCFTGYEELREVLTATFGNAEGSYLVKINEAFDRYCEITANNQDKKKGSAKEEIRADNNLDKKEIDWSSSVFVEYLCFLCKPENSVEAFSTGLILYLASSVILRPPKGFRFGQVYFCPSVWPGGQSRQSHRVLALLVHRRHLFKEDHLLALSDRP